MFNQLKQNKMEKQTKMITFSAYSAEGTGKAFKLFYANNQVEFIPKSLCTMVEGADWSEGVQPRYFEAPAWLVYRLSGVKYYGF